MNRRIRIFATIALAIVASQAVAQVISIAPVEDEPGAQTSLTINLSDAGTNITALQFNLSLPDGITLDKANVTKEAAASEHELAVRTLEGGDYLFVLYNMDKKVITQVTLLRLPITLPSMEGKLTGKLTSFCTANTDAMSKKCADALFSITVKKSKPSSIRTIVDKNATSAPIYNLSGQRLTKPQRGINVIKGKKVIVK